MVLGYPTDIEAARVSPTRPAWSPQDHTEPVILRRLLEEPTATVVVDHELVGIDQDRDGAHAELLDHSSGATIRVDADYVVAADGAHSAVRKQLGITMDGPDHLDDYERVEFRAPLAEVVGTRRHALYVVTGSDPTAVLAPRGPGDRWGLSRERHPDASGFEDMSEDQVIAVVTHAAGVDDLPVEIERINSFAFAAQIAETYRNGRAFLVGDAAHRMTPRGGTGMNTAVQDSFDLGWKLAWVLCGWADRRTARHLRGRAPTGRCAQRRSVERPGGCP